MDTLRHLLECLDTYPGFQERVSLAQIFLFLRQVSLVKNEIILAQGCSMTPATPPPQLPPSIVSFLAVSINLDEELVVQCWQVFKYLAWNSDYMETMNEDPSDAFRRLGHPFGLRTLSLNFARLSRPDKL